MHMQYLMNVFEGKDGDVPVGRRLPEGRIKRQTLCLCMARERQTLVEEER